MEFSENYHTRNEKMKALLVPSLCEVNQQLGDDLSQIFFKSCPKSLEGEMSLIPLDGPGPDLWISPSDILMNKVVLKPPLTLKYLRALTHQSLLEIGRTIEEKYFRVLEEQKQKELRELEELLIFMAEREKKRAVKEAIEREHELFKEKLLQLNEEFQLLLQEALQNLEAELKEMYEQLFEERMKNLMEEQEEITQERIRDAVNEAVEILTKKFLEDLEDQEKFLTELFELKLQGQKEKYKKLLKNEQEVFQTLLRQLKHNLQCNNISNLMYILCVERRNCLGEKQKIIDDYDAQIKGLEKSISEKNEEMEKVKKERDEKQRQCEVRERCLYGVICQFQKFINFALKASPTQAEFLLSVKKMMTFELTQAIAQTSPTKHLCKGLMPWRRDQPKPDASFDMKLRDFHDCLNERVLPKINEDGTEGSLKAFNFNSKLYVREDFRNKISQGFLVRPSSMLWNKDVENLIKILRGSLEKDNVSVEGSIQKQRSHNSSVHFGSTGADAVSASLERQDSRNVGLLGTVDSVILQKSIRSHHSFTDDQMSPSFTSKKGPGCDILAAKDSLSITNITKCTYSIEQDDEDSLSGSKIFKKISTATLSLQKPPKKPQEQVFRNISSATINLRDGRKHDDGVYKYNSPQRSIEKKSPRVSDIKKQKSLSTHKNSLEVIKERLYKKQVGIKHLLKVSYEELGDQNLKHIAVDVPLDGKKLDVNFKQVANLYACLSKGDAPWRNQQEKEVVNEEDRVEEEEVVRDDFLNKENVAKVMGHIGTEHVERTKEFTVHRLHSIIDVLKKDSSLIRIFTNCAQ